MSAKRLGNISGVDVDVVCLDPTETGIRIDRSLDGYVQERFGRIERVEIPSIVKMATGRRTGAVFEVPGLFHLMNRRALRAAMALEPSRYRAIVSWSQWHSIHLVGLALKARFPKIPWIAHFSDPWVDNPFETHSLMRPYHRSLETKVFKAADILSFTSSETIDLIFNDRSAPYANKAIELPHAYDPALYPAAQRHETMPIVVRSLGNFYGARSPEPLFRALALLCARWPALAAKISVELVGSIPPVYCDSAAFRSLPSGLVRVVPPVEYKASLALARSADLLLNIDAPFDQSVFLPSKLVDYIGAGRPIFGITPPGTASRVIRSLGGWVSEPADPEAIATTLAAALSGIEASRGVMWGAPDIRRIYEVSTVAERFKALLLSAINATAARGA